MKTDQKPLTKRKRIANHVIDLFAITTIVFGIVGVASFSGYLDKRAEDMAQSIQTYQDYKDNKIDYKTVSYILGGHGVHPAGFDSALLMSIQTQNNDFAARDETLMEALGGRYSFETQIALDSVREIFDEDYRKVYNSELKEKLTEQQYQAALTKQQTSLKPEDLAVLNSCYTENSGKGDLRKIFEISFDIDTRCAKPASPDAEKADIFKNKVSAIDVILSEKAGKQQP